MVEPSKMLAITGSSDQQIVIRPLTINPVNEILKAKAKPKIDEIKKAYVGRLPLNISDDFISRLLNCFGQVVSWKRSTDSRGQPKPFGIVEFDDCYTLYRCIRMFDGFNLCGNNLVVKVDQKYEELLNDFKNYKRSSWIEKQNKTNISVDIEDLFNRERRGDLMEWEIELVGDKEIIFKRIKEVLANKDIIEEISSKKDDHIPSIKEEIESKLKDHPRELDRCKRRQYREREQEKKLHKLAEEWKQHEKDKAYDIRREKEREKERQENKKKLIEKDKKYDYYEEKRKMKRDPEYYLKIKEERKKIREREAEDDLIETRKEMEEKLRNEEIKKKEIEEVKKKKEYEEKRAFILESEDNEIAMTKQEFDSINISKVSINVESKKEVTPALKDTDKPNKDEDDSKKLTKLDQTLLQVMGKIGQENQDRLKEEEKQNEKAKQILENLDKDEGAKKDFEKLKHLFEVIPKDKNGLYKYPVDWNIADKNDIYEKKLRPWITQKVREYLGVEEQDLIKMILKKVKKRSPPQEIQDKLSNVFEKEAEPFVMKMWKIMIFEIMKYESLANKLPE